MLFSSTQSIHILNFESSASVGLHSEFHSTGVRQSRLSYLGLGAYWLSKAFSASSRLSSKSAMLLVQRGQVECVQTGHRVPSRECKSSSNQSLSAFNSQSSAWGFFPLAFHLS